MRYVLLTISLAAAAALLVPLAMKANGSGTHNVSRALTVPIAATVPDEFKVPLRPYWAAFQETNVSAGTRALLPDGNVGLDARQAVVSASNSPFGEPGPGVQVAARYGTYSAQFPAKRSATGRMQPLFQSRPVWIVTYFGPSFNIPTRKFDSAGNRIFKHSINIVVDARTGDVLVSFG